MSFDEVSEVSCAYCGFQDTHQDEVVVYNRVEDAEEGQRIHISPFHEPLRGVRYPPTVTLTASMEGNPSPRRQGVSIFLSCEQCEGATRLSVFQHKGATMVTRRKA